MDDAVGAVLNALRDAGVEDDTLIIFHSDNGGPPSANASRNDPLRGSKGTTWEGGIRVPFFIQWKRQLPGGKTFDHPVISLDDLPTAVAAAGGRIAATPPGDAAGAQEPRGGLGASPERVPAAGGLDGVNLLPYLKGEKQGPPHEALFWRFGRQAAIRKGNLKLVRTTGDWELYDLAADIGEKTDLAAQKPDIVKDLTAAYDAWNAQLAEPLWGARGGAQRIRRLLRPGKGKA